MKNNNGKSILPAAPYIVWSSLFIVIPLLIVIFFSFTISTPDGYKFSLANFERLLDPNYFTVFKRSIWLALKATIGCLILGYPVRSIDLSGCYRLHPGTGCECHCTTRR